MKRIVKASNVVWIAAVVAMVVLLVPQPIYADSDPPWYDTDWGCRNTITIDCDRVSNANQSDFTVLVDSIYPAWKDTANGGNVGQSDGGDILFTSSDGITKLSHEIERYDPATGELIGWVKVPTVSASSDTTIYIYYGNAVCADQWATDGSTWLSSYRGVWHFKENPSGTAPQMKDSTSPANDGTTSGGMTTAQQVAGQIDGGLSYDGNDNVQMANESDFDFQSSSPFTIEYWAKPTTGNTAIQQPVSKMAEASPWRGYEVSHNNNNGTNSPGYLRVTLVFSEPATNFISVSTASATNLNDGSWHHYVYTYDGSGAASGVKVYEDGVPFAVTSSQDTLSGNPLNNIPLSVGSRNNTNRFYRGVLDEVRVSAAALTGDGIATEYNNQRSPATFYSIGATELRLGPTLISPANHTLTNDNTVDLDWSEVAWASRYQVVVDNNPDFLSPEYDPGWGAGWLPGYSYRKTITIDHTQVAADLSGFPVLVSISSDNDLRTTGNGGYVQSSSGYDIAFTSS
ncbi:MAG: DUF2341 domain-containing protein, partial [Chloroflexi bacterium]|nr:DUF2341 domain-containing protein [Chloroflexota bacterium]